MTTYGNPACKIDADWTFLNAEAPGAQAADFDDSAWRRVNLPHDWSIEGAFAREHFIPACYDANHLEGRGDSYLPKGIGWYRKRLNLPRLSGGDRVYLEFEGVFRDSTLWVNGQRAGGHVGGYTSAVYDITPWIRRDGRTDVLALRVDAREVEGWWYEGAGIYRHVWLMVKPALHLTPWGVAVTTPAVSYTAATVAVRTSVRNGAPRPVRARLRTTIGDGRGNTVGVVESEMPVDAGQSVEFLQECALADPHLWSPAAPNLYTASSELVAPDGVGDRTETVFGIRWFEFTPDRGFFLNGRPLQLRGGNIHHDFGGLGTALPDRANARTVEALKAMGANTIRSAHNPAAPALMDACDRLGMLLWAETRNLYTDKSAEEDLRALIRRDRNHPCIFVWGLANTAGSSDGRLTACLRQLNDLAHRLDPSRPTAVGLEGNAGANDNGFALVTDVVGYNGGGMGIDDRDHRLYPARRMLHSEYASGRGARGVYEKTTPANAEMETFGDGRVLVRGGQYASSYDLCLEHEREWRHIAARPWLAGGLMWSAIEYRGETAGWPIVTSQFGVLDICRFPKDAYYFYQKEWTTQPMLHLFPHWTWPGKEGQRIEVWCYSNCDTVDLFLNGEKVPGIPHFLQNGASWPHISWHVPYAPGTLCAEGRVNGQVVCRREVRTAGASAALRLTPDRATIHADGEDLSFVTVSVHDAAGEPVPTACVPVTVEVTGCGRLLGLSSGDPASHESEKGSVMRTFNGLCLAIVQSDGREGDIRVAVAADDVTGATVQLSARGGRRPWRYDVPDRPGVHRDPEDDLAEAGSVKTSRTTS